MGVLAMQCPSDWVSYSCSTFKAFVDQCATLLMLRKLLFAHFGFPTVASAGTSYFMLSCFNLHSQLVQCKEWFCLKLLLHTMFSLWCHYQFPHCKSLGHILVLSPMCKNKPKCALMLVWIRFIAGAGVAYLGCLTTVSAGRL